jgi:hypothetical protein
MAAVPLQGTNRAESAEELEGARPGAVRLPSLGDHRADSLLALWASNLP